MSVKQYVQPFFSFVAQQNDFNRQTQMSEGRYNVLMQHYQQQMNDATSAFNRSYYRNYLDNSNARNMLKRVREQLGEQTKAMRNAAVVTGATPEAAAAVQKNNNRVLDSVVGTLANIDADAKVRAENAYEERKRELGDFRLGAAVNRYNEQSAIELARKRNENNFFISSGTKILDKIIGFLNLYNQADEEASSGTSADAGMPMNVFGNQPMISLQEKYGK